MPTLQHLPPWTISYKYSVSPSQTRTREMGFKSQSRLSHRHLFTASASRRLLLSQLPYWEWFIRGLCNNGASKFTDYYADGNNLQTATIRLVDGAYSVKTDTRTHIVTCEIEVFRG